MKKSWYAVTAKATSGSAEISVYDEIGLFGFTAKQFITDLRAIDAESIQLSINSPGGSVFDAIAIYNALRQHPANINVKVMGVAASAASIIAMAGDKIVMPENTFIMIHNPLNFAYGNADDLRDMADVLDKVAASLIATYVARTGNSEADIKDMLDAETWLNAEEAVAKGFADELEPALKIAACFDLDRLPETIRATIAPPAEIEPPAEQTDDAAEKAEAEEITALCQAAGLPGKAEALISARVPVATVRVQLLEARAALDALTHTDNHIPQPTQAPQSAINYAGIYAARRQ